jgi:hypothetical protein
MLEGKFIHRSKKSVRMRYLAFRKCLIRIFVVGGYDIGFEIVKCSINYMLDDIYKQVIYWDSVDSKIYEIYLK